jgi:3-phosphoshikimate 1-carboxyvinyltransferase
LTVQGGGALRGEIVLPGDKSISHRALVFNAFATGKAQISGLLQAEDVARTAQCLSALGIRIEGDVVVGSGGRLQAPQGLLDCGNSGTTIRLLLGLLSGQDFSATLSGDASLQRRPMARVTDPLTELGASFSSRDGRPPVTVHGGAIQGTQVTSGVASAQVKTAVLLAGLQGSGALQYTEPCVSRDHSERMLEAMGALIDRSVDSAGVHCLRMACGQGLTARDVVVPGDISSAAFFLVAGSVTPGSELTLQRVGLNPTRTGVLDVLARMGASIEVQDAQTVSGEPMGTLHVQSRGLKGTVIEGSEIPRLIDELPVIAVAAALAEGETVVRDAAELRVKESDRILATVRFLRDMGVEADERPDGMVILGKGWGSELRPATVHAGGDHRIAMAAAVAGLCGRGETVVSGAETIATSFPEFPRLLESLRV